MPFRKNPGPGSGPEVGVDGQPTGQVELFPGSDYEPPDGIVLPDLIREIGKIGVAKARRALDGCRQAERTFDPPGPAGEADPPPPHPAAESLGRRFFDGRAIHVLRRRLESIPVWPLMTLDDRDTLINDPTSYFRAIRHKVVPDPESTDSLASRQRRAEASARQGRARAYAEQAVINLSLVDSCRSWHRYLNGQPFQPVRLDDTPAATHRQVAAGLKDLLVVARQDKLLIGGHSREIVDRLQADFDRLGPAGLATGHPQRAIQTEFVRQLTALVGRNAALKADLWACQLRSVSRGWRLVDKDTLALLADHDRQRLDDYRRRCQPLAPLLAHFAAAESQSA